MLEFLLRLDEETRFTARALYEKRGFVVEGTRKDTMIVDGSYVDEYYMARLLG